MSEKFPDLALIAKQKINNNIECIGPWCHLADFSNGNFSGLEIDYYNPYSGDLKKQQMSIKALDYHDRFIHYFAETLNQHHGRSYSVKYWSILLSASVTYTIESVLHKIAIIESNKKYYQTEVFDLKSHPVIDSTRSLLSWLNSDDGTLYTFTHILLKSDQNKIIIKKENNLAQKKIDKSVIYRKNKRTLFEYLKIYVSIIFSLRNGVYIDSIPGLTYKDIFALKIKGQKKTKVLFRDRKKTKPNKVSREEVLSGFKPKNLDEEIILSVLAYTLPTVFFENYKKYEKVCSFPSYLISKFFDKLFCGPVLGGNDIAKFVLAKCIDNNIELIISQHGCNYGTASIFTTMNACEYKNCNRFISWGWNSHSNYKINVDPLSSPYLSKLKSIHSNTLIHEIVFVGNNLSLYGDRISSSPEAQALSTFFEDKAKFITCLSDYTLNLLRYKPFPTRDYCLIDEASFIKSKVTNIIFKKNDKNNFLTTSRLLVADHPGTIMLERFVVNKPIVLYFDKSIWSFSKQSQEFFDLLNEVGVLYYDPYLAANFVNLNYESCEEWWYSNVVQNAISIFVNNYAKNSENFIHDWQEYLSI